MRPETREHLSLTAKTLALALGGILTVAALVDLVVAGVSVRALLVLLAGLLLAVPPLAFAFRDALREARKGRA